MKGSMRKFIEFKQSLLKPYGVTETLVPNEQIEEYTLKQWQQFYDRLKTELKANAEVGDRVRDDSICPYCAVRNSCVGCIMDDFDNKCSTEGSTYHTATLQLSRATGSFSIIESIPDIATKVLDWLKDNIEGLEVE